MSTGAARSVLIDEIQREFLKGIEIGVGLVLVIEQQGSGIRAVIFRGEADKLHDLRQRKGGKELLHGGVVLENTPIHRDAVKIRGDVIRHARIRAEGEAYDLESVIGGDIVAFIIDTIHLGVAILKINIDLIVEIFILNGNTVLLLAREAIERDHTVLVAVFFDGFSVDNGLPDLFKRLFDGVGDEIFLPRFEIVLLHFHRVRESDRRIADLIGLARGVDRALCRQNEGAFALRPDEEARQRPKQRIFRAAAFH